MYKIKVAVLYTNSNSDCLWNYGWLDWDGLDNDVLEEDVKNYGKSEEKNLQNIVDKSIVVKDTVVLETYDTTNGDYLCKKCECYFDNPDDGDCPFCGSGLIAFNAKLDTDKKCYNHCPNCGATDPDINWGKKDAGGDIAWQNATCRKCGQDFSEVYTYSFTENRHNR